MKWFKWILLSLLGLLIVLSVSVTVYLYSRNNSYNGSVSLIGLIDSVEVYFDSFGVPHIYGNTEEDVFRALGYIHASERLFQMEMIRRVSAGRLSELFGSAMLDVDRFFRTLGLPYKAAESAKTFQKHKGEAWNKAAFAYLEGINSYIENGKTPVEFTLMNIPKTRYTPEDLYLIVSYVAFNFQMAFRTDPLIEKIRQEHGIEYLRDLYHPENFMDSMVNRVWVPEDRQHESGISSAFSNIGDLLPVSVWTGSNAVLIAPSRSSTAKVLFENDTHVGHQQPSIWYESHLEYPGFSFLGYNIAGFPFAPLGQTTKHIWGVTIFENDDLDFYREKTNPDDTNQVWFVDKWEDMSLRPDTIRVKDSSDVVILIRNTRHGPVCSDIMNDFSFTGNEPVSACWTFLKEPDNLLQITYGLAHAQNMEEFRSELSKLAAPGLNFLYADNEDNIAWWAAARIVRRPDGVHSDFILDGSSGKEEWLGYYDFSQNPTEVNPEKGYIFSTNQRPEPVQGVLYPGYYLPSDRELRIKELLSSKAKFKPDDLKSVFMDDTNPVASEACRIMLAVMDRNLPEMESGMEEVLRILADWNGSHTLKDIAPSFYYQWFFRIYELTFNDDLGEDDASSFRRTHLQKSNVLHWLRNDSSLWWDNVLTKDRKELRIDIVKEAFLLAYRDLEKQYGKSPLSWTWDRLHTLELVHPAGKNFPLNMLFNAGPVPVEGGIETLNNQSFEYEGKPEFKSNLGAAVRRFYDFASPEQAWSVLPGGQSGIPLSPHYTDQFEMYVNEKLKEVKLNKAEILKHHKNKLTFLPVEN
jgi:penicillin amidase